MCDGIESDAQLVWHGGVCERYCTGGGGGGGSGGGGGGGCGGGGECRRATTIAIAIAIANAAAATVAAAAPTTRVSRGMRGRRRVSLQWRRRRRRWRECRARRAVGRRMSLIVDYEARTAWYDADSPDGGVEAGDGVASATQLGEREHAHLRPPILLVARRRALRRARLLDTVGMGQNGTPRGRQMSAGIAHERPVGARCARKQHAFLRRERRGVHQEGAQDARHA